MMAWQCTPSTGMCDGRPGDRAVGQFVVERARQDARGRGLADAAHAGEDPGLRDAAGLERVRERAHHGVLADQVVEGRRAVFARQHAVARRPRRRGPPADGRAFRWPSCLWRRSSWLRRHGARLDGKFVKMNRWEADERPEPELVRAASFRT